MIRQDVGDPRVFLEKHSRFFRKYEIVLSPRNPRGKELDLVTNENNCSVLDALEKRIAAEKALIVQSNGDIIELMRIVHMSAENALVLLFHRASPNAADPIYRKRARKKVTTRKAERLLGEEPAVSAHMVINLTAISSGRYEAVLEEIPGMSMGILKPIISQALNDYKYEFTDTHGHTGETYCVVKAEGIKSESISNALQKGHIDWITLVRPARPDFVDAEGIFKPTNETMKIKVDGSIDGRTWMRSLEDLLKGAKKNGWEDFKIELELDDERKRTVQIEREQEAKEILFVRAEQANVPVELSPCATEIVEAIVLVCNNIMKKSKKVS